MQAHHPDHATTRAVLERAQRAPSVHNSQPWRWLWDGAELHLQPDMARWLPVVDPVAVDLVMSCGVVLHHARVAFAAAGWATVVRSAPDHGEHLATLDFHRAAPQQSDLTGAVATERRRTDHRRYSSWPVPVSCTAELIREAERAGVVAHHLETGSVPAGALLEDGQGTAAVSDRGASGDAGELILLSTPGSDLRSQLAVGEAASAMVLAATTIGLACCLISRPDSRPFTQHPIRRDPGGPWIHPRLVLRIGWAPVGLRAIPASQRRPLTDVMVIRDEGRPLSRPSRSTSPDAPSPEPQPVR